MAESTIIPVPYNYDEILQILKDMAISSGLATDTDYEGSNISEIARVLAYAVQSANVNLTKAVNESLLTKTSDYTIAYKLARQIGYIPKSKISYQYNLTLSPYMRGIFRVPQYSEFKSDNLTYVYMGDTIDTEFNYYITSTSKDLNGAVISTPVLDLSTNKFITLEVNNIVYEAKIIEQEIDSTDDTKCKYYLDFSGNIDITLLPANFVIKDENNNSLYLAQSDNLYDVRKININVKEGKIKKYYDELYNPDGERDLFIQLTETDENGLVKNYIDLDYRDVEDDGIDLFVTYFGEDQTLYIKEKWNKRFSLLTDRNNSLDKKTFVSIINEDTKTLRIYFKYAGTGYTPPLNSKVYINLLISSGSAGKAVSNFDNITLSSDIWEIKDYTLNVTGRDEEDLSNIKINAPTFATTGMRAVTGKDYIAIGSSIRSVYTAQCWGGDNDIPIQNLGHVYLSFIPDYRPTTYTADNINTYFTRDIDEIKFNLLDTELYGNIYNINGELDLTNAGVMDILNQYKVITLDLHNIKTTYIDIDMSLNIKKYLGSLPISTQNLDIFNAIKDYFLMNYEKYDVDFFLSNLVRIADEHIGDSSGIIMDITSKVKINKYLPYTPVQYRNPGDTCKYIDFYLKLPFGKITNEFGEFDISKFPIIFAKDVNINGNIGNIYVQDIRTNTFSGYIIPENERYTDLYIRFGYSTEPYYKSSNSTNNTDPIIGKIYIDNVTKEILYRFYVDCPEGILTYDYLNNLNPINLELDLIYPDNTIRTCRNSVLRLHSVKYE